MRSLFASAVIAVSIGCGGNVDSEAGDAAPDSVSADSATSEVSADSASGDSSAIDTFLGDTATRDAGWTDLAITGNELSPWEGKTIWFIVQNRVMPGELSRASTKIVAGVAKVTIPDTMPPDHFGVGVNVFIDLNDDAACNGTDPAWFDIASNMFGKSESPYTFKPSTASKIACSEIGK